MSSSIAHRGPDGRGAQVFDNVGLAHTRLSIIDVAGGSQPLENEDGTVWVTFNGEVYNYRELMSDLRARGHTFRTRSDTEVLVHLYEEYGDRFVTRLNGMFAFALFDRRNARLILARDHFGVKPLFYAVRDGTLYFGSEIKAVLAGLGHVQGPATVDVQEYLLFRTIAGDRSFFPEVRRLRPGSIGVWQNGHVVETSYWEPPVPDRSSEDSLDEAATALGQRLDSAVKSQLMSEVPLGTFCSGGVDSGLTSHYTSRASDHVLHTFSVGFDDSRWDESALAMDTAKRVGSIHHVLKASPAAFLEALPKVIWNHDEPISHPNSVLIALLSVHAREHVTVVLTGEGSDEIFGGYPRHHIVRANAIASHSPMWLRRLGAGAFRLGGRKMRMLGERLALPFSESVVLNSAYLSPDLVARLTGTGTDDAIGRRTAIADQFNVPGDALASISRYDQRTYLPCLLDRMDRMTMAAGLEGRVPFLDLELAHWAGHLPTSHLLGHFGNKRVVKHLAMRHLSRSVTHGPKSGFGVPVGDWLRTPGWADAVAQLRDPTHPATAAVDGRVVRELVDSHMSGAPGLDDAMWLLLNLYQWHQVRFDV